MSQTVNVVDEGSTIRLTDGSIQIDIYKSKLNCTTDPNGNVILQWDSVHYLSYPASQFASPSGTATQIQASIAAMMNLH